MILLMVFTWAVTTAVYGLLLWLAIRRLFAVDPDTMRRFADLLPTLCQKAVPKPEEPEQPKDVF